MIAVVAAASLAVHHVLASWWNPWDDIKSVWGAISGVAGIPGAIENVLSIVGTIGSEFLKLFLHPADFFKDVVKWILNALFPKDVYDGLLGQLGPNDAAASIYAAVEPVGLLFAGLACVARAIRVVADHRAPASVLFADVLPRLIVVYGVILAGYPIMSFIVNAGQTIGESISGVILGASLAGMSIFHIIYSMILDLISGADVLSIIGIIPVLLMAVYCIILLVLRGVMIAFAAAVAPLCVGIAVFDHRNKFVQWWADLFIGAALIPAVLWPCISVSLAIAARIMGETNLSELAFGPAGVVIHGLAQGLAADIVLFCGLWLSGKVVHQLTWRHFSHGGAVGAIMAGATAAFSLPMLAQKGLFFAKGMGHEFKEGGMADRFMHAAMGLYGFDPFPGMSGGYGKGGGAGGAAAGMPGGGGGGGAGGGGLAKVKGALAMGAGAVAAPATGGASLAAAGAAGGGGAALAGGAAAGGGGAAALAGGGGAGALGGGGAAGAARTLGNSSHTGGASSVRFSPLGGGGGGGGGFNIGGGGGGGPIGGGGGGGIPSGPPRQPFGGNPITGLPEAMRNLGGNAGNIVNHDPEGFSGYFSSALDGAMDADQPGVIQRAMELADANHDELGYGATFDDYKTYYATHMPADELSGYMQDALPGYLGQTAGSVTPRQQYVTDQDMQVAMEDQMRRLRQQMDPGYYRN